MNYDCGITKENHWFRYRAGGILIHDNKMLFVKSANADFYYMIGGGVRLGETSASCAEREIFEETGIRARAERLAVVCENFFKGVGGTIDGRDCHTVEFYYYMNILEDTAKVCPPQTDDGEELVWLPIETLQDHNIKPEFIKDNIHRILHEQQILHLVEEKDR